MAKRYELVDDETQRTLSRVREAYYGEYLVGVTIDAMFVQHDDPDKKDEQVLTHGGYPAAATCRIVNTRDRAAGMADVQIVIDRAVWASYLPNDRDALLDHELHHIERVLESDGTTPKRDVQGRPKLALRKHDWQLGWFNEVAERHGKHSTEVRQARMIYKHAHQLYFPFDEDKAA